MTVNYDLDFELDLDGIKMKRHGKYIDYVKGQFVGKSSSTHTRTRTHTRAQPTTCSETPCLLNFDYATALLHSNNI